MSTLALIGLGSNLGDRRATLEAAADLLGESPGISVRAFSSLHETEAVGGPGGQGAYLNAAAALATSLDPASLLRRLREIEERLGRMRAVRWGERTLDLDLLLFGDSIIDTPELTVPHLRMAVRRFVIAPLAEIAPQAIDPLTRRTVADLLDNLDRRPGVIFVAPSAREPGIVQALRGAIRPERWVVMDSWTAEVSPERRPTFLVVAGEEADVSLGDWAEWNHRYDPVVGQVPVLRVRATAAEGIDQEQKRGRIIAEVLAAFASAGD
jgi:2-amino-4-hydroxy-6-hydroxymethyldihydropteridine diphosphokinase